MKSTLVFRLISESFKVALSSLWANRLRTILSLLGITIGIYAIILVYSAVDSLEYSIRDSVQTLGDDVVYVQKMPWNGGGSKWWKLFQRPEAQYKDYEEVKKRIRGASAVGFVYGAASTLKRKNNSVENASVLAATHEYDKIWSLKIERGRYFTESESNGGKPMTIIGYDLAQALFGEIDPIGKRIKILGRKVTVIGVMEKEGASLIGNNNDVTAIVPALYLMKTRNPLHSSGNAVMVKAKPDVEVAELKDELMGIMRSVRRLKPSAEENFALNEISIMAEGMDAIFGVFGWVGTIIGGFSILIGGFGIANIMFVSVKERTGQVGIQKSLGAKRSFVMWQFIFEAIVLCLIGGVVGLILVYTSTKMISEAADFKIFLSISNVILGVGLSVAIGIISGIIPAIQAAHMDPVKAIRFNG